MITVEEALQLVQSNCPRLPSRRQALVESLGCVLSDDVSSPINMPPFRQSAMDGYALNYNSSSTVYAVIGEVPAGSSAEIELSPGEAVRIFTGAKIPDTATTVIQQEWVKQEGSEISFEREISDQLNIRAIGEQINKDDLALTKSTVLTPAAIGFLATLGITHVNVVPRPKVSILTTGNELVSPGNELMAGKIYESNSVMLEMALRDQSIQAISIDRVQDDFNATVLSLRKHIEASDLVLVTGGVSVGEYDFVDKALNELGVNEHFHKVKQKPGKPLYYGSKGHTQIFGLPGNPAAAMTCFYMYVLPCIQQMSGKEFKGLKSNRYPLLHSYERKGDRAQFLKSYLDKNGVQILGSQSSAMLNSYAESNCLVYLDLTTGVVNQGEEVTVFLLSKEE